MRGALWTDRRFWPLFWTQFLGAFNDNLYKNALVMMITFGAVSVGGLDDGQMVALAGAAFILPYFLFSATAGQVTDAYDKARVIRATKDLEILVMLGGAYGLATGNVVLLLGLLFLMGAQSTAFGPSKYGILPQHLDDPADLVAANALVEMGTNLAILTGTLLGGVLAGLAGGQALAAAGVVAVAVAGRVTAQFVPAAPPSAPGLAVRLDPIRPTLDLVALCRRERPIWLAILGISWFWAYASLFLSLFPAWTEDVLHGTEGLATLFLALFSVGTGVGSILCERLSRDRVELGLVPLGALGMSLFALDLVLVGEPWGPVRGGMTVGAFLTTLTGWRICIDLWLLSLSSGLLIVPLYTFVQHRSHAAERARVIAGNNVVNAFFMVLGQFVLVALYALGLGPVAVLGVLALVNVAVAVYMYSVVAEYLLRFTVWVLSNLVYRLKVEGHERIPREGAAVLVCNHVSFVDWFVVAAGIRTPLRFVMHHSYYDLPVMKWLFRQAGVIPIASAKDEPALLERAMDRISEDLKAGWMVCIFPEGAITADGELQPFRSGIERIVARDPVPVVPMALVGLWGSFFSRKDGRALTKPFRRGAWSRVTLRVGEPVPAPEVTADGMRERVKALLGGGS